MKEVKLVRCIRGAIYDVIIDVRKDSPTYTQWLGVELDAEGRRMLYAPAGICARLSLPWPTTPKSSIRFPPSILQSPSALFDGTIRRSTSSGRSSPK